MTTTSSGRSPDGSGYSAEPEPCSTVSAVPVSIPNARVCAWCRQPKQRVFYRGRREARCPCNHDYRTPQEARRDTVLEKYGDDPEAYTPAVLKELAEQGLFDIAAAFCPAGRLTMAETKAREASGIEAGTDETAKQAQPEGREPGPQGDAQDIIRGSNG